MNCDQAKFFIQPYADGELDAARILDLEKHIRECSACALAWRNQLNLKKAMKPDELYFTAPKELRQQIKVELHTQFGNQSEQKFWNWNWLTTATTALAAVCLAFLLMSTLSRPTAQQELAQEIISGHIRSLMANHALDVVSTDQHTVKPWFDGKLTFAPPVKDFTVQEFPLIGGRLDYLAGNPVAALVYQRHKHIINVFIWPTQEADTNPTAIAPLQGYHLVHWSRAGMNFWVVSDVNANELLEFSNDWLANAGNVSGMAEPLPR